MLQLLYFQLNSNFLLCAYQGPQADFGGGVVAQPVPVPEEPPSESISEPRTVSGDSVSQQGSTGPAAASLQGDAVSTPISEEATATSEKVIYLQKDDADCLHATALQCWGSAE